MLAANTHATPKRGRKPRFDRARTVQAIADLFWERGYDGVALSDVMAATGLSKSSLYNSFGDKDDLFRVALSAYHDDVVAAGAQWLSLDDGSDPWDTLDALLSGPAADAFGDTPDRRGCFLCNTAADGPRTHGSQALAIDALVGQGFAQLTDGAQALLRRAAPGAGEHALRAAARLVITAYAGLRMRSRHAETRAELDDVRETLVRMLRDSLSGPV